MLVLPLQNNRPLSTRRASARRWFDVSVGFQSTALDKLDG